MALIRVMDSTDVERVTELEQAASEHPWNEQLFRDCLQVGYSCWVVELEQQVQGFAMMTLQAGESHLLNLVIAESHRRQGLGRLLLEHLLQTAEAAAMQFMLLEVRVSNIAAQRLYQNYGFSQIAIREKYYKTRNGREDAVVMRKWLTAR